MAKKNAANVVGVKTKTTWKQAFKRDWQLYLLLLLPLIMVFVFSYGAYPGLRMAFMDYKPAKGYAGSEWVGMKTFVKIFKDADFMRALRNSIVFNLADLIIGFPMPIILALILNELRYPRFKKVSQTILYLPHFLSWVVIYGIFVSFLGSTGVINSVITSLGFEPVSFLMDSGKFRGILVIADAWKEIGWSSIIYFAAIAGLDQECFEAADVDGATRIQKIWYITLPSLLPTIVLMLIIRVGNIMNAGFDQIFVFYNPTVYDVADIIGTYVYRMGLGKLEFSTGTAVGLFNSVISMILVHSSNFIARKATGKGIW